MAKFPLVFSFSRFIRILNYVLHFSLYCGIFSVFIFDTNFEKLNAKENAVDVFEIYLSIHLASVLLLPLRPSLPRI